MHCKTCIISILLQFEPSFLQVPLLQQAWSAAPGVEPAQRQASASSKAISDPVPHMHMHVDSLPACDHVHLVGAPKPHHYYASARSCAYAHLSRHILHWQACCFQLPLQLSRAAVLCQNTDGSLHDMLPVASLTRGHVALACCGGCSIDR